MRRIQCARCGLVFEADKEVAMCDKCRREIKLNSVLRDRECQSCGRIFLGGPRAWFCPDCRAERRKKAAAEYQVRARAGKARKIGSAAICEVCGKPYTVVGSLQRYCKECAPEAIKEADRQDGIVYMSAHAKESKERKQKRSRERKVCVICGKQFYSGDASVTCSADCDKMLKGQQRAATDYKNGRRKTPEYGVVLNNSNPKSGIVGVTWCRGKWQATLKGKYIGLYNTVEEASEALRRAQEEKPESKAPQ